MDSPKILLVEDNEMNLDMLSRRLKRQGFEVVTAEDGVKGLIVAETESPHLILLDMSLPGMDGWETAQRLKSMPETSSIPIIGLSAHAMEQDRQRALAAGCNDYDTKPVEITRLLEKIQVLLDKEDHAS